MTTTPQTAARTLSNAEVALLMAKFTVLAKHLQDLYEQSLEGHPDVSKQGTVSPAVGGIQKAVDELIQTRKDAATKTLVREMARHRIARMYQLEGKANSYEVVFILLGHLEQARRAKKAGFDHDEKFTSYCVYQLSKNYSEVLDTLKETFRPRVMDLYHKRLRKFA